jgi:hypothetical protein
MSCFVTTSNNVAGMHPKKKKTKRRRRKKLRELVCKREIVVDYADYTVPMSLNIIEIY